MLGPLTPRVVFLIRSQIQPADSFSCYCFILPAKNNCWSEKFPVPLWEGGPCFYTFQTGLLQWVKPSGTPSITSSPECGMFSCCCFFVVLWFYSVLLLIFTVLCFDLFFFYLSSSFSYLSFLSLLHFACLWSLVLVLTIFFLNILVLDFAHLSLFFYSFTCIPFIRFMYLICF